MRDRIATTATPVENAEANPVGQMLEEEVVDLVVKMNDAGYPPCGDEEATRHLSHNFFVPSETVSLSPFAAYRAPGQLCNASRTAVRAIRILEILASAGRPLRAVEIAAPVGLSPSSANQILKTMMDAGYLIFDPLSKHYSPSPRVLKLSGQVSGDYHAPQALDALMRAMQEAIGGPVSLMACQGSFMQVLEVLWPSEQAIRVAPFPIDATVGMRVPLFGSCTGAAWLFCQTETTIRAAMHLCRRELGKEKNKAAQIIERLRQFREQGYAFGGISLDDNVRGFAVPLPPAANGIVLVLALLGRTRDMEARREEMARVSKALIQQHLGPPPPRTERPIEAWACGYGVVVPREGNRRRPWDQRDVVVQRGSRLS